MFSFSWPIYRSILWLPVLPFFLSSLVGISATYAQTETSHSSKQQQPDRATVRLAAHEEPALMYLALRDLLHLPFGEMLKPGSDSNWVVAIFTTDGIPFVEDRYVAQRTGRTKDPDYLGSSFRGKAEVLYTVGHGVPVELKNYEMQAQIFFDLSGPAHTFTDSINRVAKPFSSGGEALVQVVPAAVGNRKFAQAYLLPTGWGRYIAEAMPIIEREAVLRAAVDRPTIPQPPIVKLLFDRNMPGTIPSSVSEFDRKDRFPSDSTVRQPPVLSAAARTHLLAFLRHDNPLIVAIAYNALREDWYITHPAGNGSPGSDFTDTKYGSVVLERQWRSQKDSDDLIASSESMFYRTLLSSEYRLSARLPAYQRLEREIENAPHVADLYQIAATIRATGGFSDAANTLMATLMKKAQRLIAHPSPGVIPSQVDENQIIKKMKWL